MVDSDEDQSNLKNRDKFQSERDEFDSKAKESESKNNQEDSFDRWRSSNNGRQGGRPNTFRRPRYGGDSRGYGNGSRGGQGFNYNRDSNNSFTLKKFQENMYKQKMSFKLFVQFQDDNITPDDSIQKYKEYLNEFNKHQVHLFVDLHKNNEWMLNLYHPYFQTIEKIRLIRMCRRRLRAFHDLSSCGLLEICLLNSSSNTVTLLIDVVNCFLNNIPYSEVVELIEKDKNVREENKNKEDPALMFDDLNNSAVKKRKITAEEGEEVWDEKTDYDTGEPTTFKAYRNTSIVLTKIPCSIKKSTLIKAYKEIEGFLRVCIMPPDPDSSFTRNVFLTFKPSADIEEVWEAVKDIKLDDCIVASYIDYNTSPIIRAIRGYWTVRKVVLEHLKMAEKLIERFDEDMFVYCKTLPQLPDFNPEARSNKTAESKNESSSSADCSDEDTTGEPFEIPDRNPFVEKLQSTIQHLSALCSTEESSLEEVEPEVLSLLDSLLIYLRVVHACDFYGFSRNLSEYDLPSRCPGICVRKTQVYTDIKYDKIVKLIEENTLKVQKLAQTEPQLLTDEELVEFVPKNEKTEINNFVEKNTVELHPDVWLCPLSEKKFKAKEYVQKHIYNKFMHMIDNIKMEVIYYNNYLRDKNRMVYVDTTNPANTLDTSKVENDDKNDRHISNKFANDAPAGYNAQPRKRTLTRYVDLDAPETDNLTFF